MATKNTSTWHRPGYYVSEPQFVARPGGMQEDDGVLLFIATDTHKKRSGLVMLDAQTFKQQAIAWLDVHVPLGYHALFVKE